MGMNVDRREFLRTTAAASGTVLALAGGAAISPFSQEAEAADASDWAPVSFEKLVLHDCPLFDGVQGRLQKDRMVVVEGGKIAGIGTDIGNPST